MVYVCDINSKGSLNKLLRVNDQTTNKAGKNAVPRKV